MLQNEDSNKYSELSFSIEKDLNKIDQFQF